MPAARSMKSSRVIDGFALVLASAARYWREPYAGGGGRRGDLAGGGAGRGRRGPGRCRRRRRTARTGGAWRSWQRTPRDKKEHPKATTMKTERAGKCQRFLPGPALFLFAPLGGYF